MLDRSRGLFTGPDAETRRRENQGVSADQFGDSLIRGAKACRQRREGANKRHEGLDSLGECLGRHGPIPCNDPVKHAQAICSRPTFKYQCSVFTYLMVVT